MHDLRDLRKNILVIINKIKCPTQCISIVRFPKNIFEHATFVDFFHYIIA